MATSQIIGEATNGAVAGSANAMRRTIATYRRYASAERAIDYLADHGFAVERSAIVGRGLRSVEQVEGRMSTGRAAPPEPRGGADRDAVRVAVRRLLQRA